MRQFECLKPPTSVPYPAVVVEFYAQVNVTIRRGWLPLLRPSARLLACFRPAWCRPIADNLRYMRIIRHSNGRSAAGIPNLLMEEHEECEPTKQNPDGITNHPYRLHECLGNELRHDCKRQTRIRPANHPLDSPRSSNRSIANRTCR